MRNSVTVLSFLSFVSVTAVAGADSITIANGFNVVTRGNMTLRSDVAGRVSVGGNATFSNFAVGTADGGGKGTALAADATRYDLIVGGHASLSGGSIDKGSAYASSATMNSVGFPTTGAGLQTGSMAAGLGPMFDVLVGMSDELRGLAANGTSLLQWGGLTLSGTDAALNVFDIDASQLVGIHSLNIVVPTSSTVLFNVSGDSLRMQSMGINVNGRQDNAMSSQMLWNFHTLSTLDLSGLGWRGSILAPSATLSFAGGSMNGQVLVDTLYSDWGVGYTNFAFSGALPLSTEQPEPEPVPEPTSTLLVSAGLVSAGMVIAARRFRRRA